jgi:tetratricopeptide (TPR) repeat protein
MPSLELLPFSARASNTFVSYGRYIAKLAWPANLSIFYPRPPHWPVWQIAGSALLLILASFAAILLFRRLAFFSTGWFWFLGMLVPVIGLVQVGEQSMADRYNYLPSVGLFIVAIWGLAPLAARNRPLQYSLSCLTILCLLACIGLTHQQVQFWRNSESLFTHALEVTADNAIAQFSLANALIDSGRVDEGASHLRKAIEIQPELADAHGRLAFLLVSQGKIDEAIKHYDLTLQLRPNLPEALNNLAWMKATYPDPKYRDGSEAVRLAERACEITHFDKTVFIGTLAAAYAEAGRFDLAVSSAERARSHAQKWKETDLANKNEQLLSLYKQGKPYHESR